MSGLKTPRGRGFSMRDVAVETSLCLRTVKTLIASGDLVAYRVGKRVIVWERDLEAWRESLPVITPRRAKTIAAESGPDAAGVA